ncbi:MAG: tetratricopeptide repeat protein [Reyranellaceae bacterium]
MGFAGALLLALAALASQPAASQTVPQVSEPAVIVPQVGGPQPVVSPTPEPAKPEPAKPAAAPPATAKPVAPAPAASPPASPAAASSPAASSPADPPRAGMAKAWGELLAAEREKQAAAKPAADEEKIDGRVRGVGTGRGQGGKPPELSEADQACQRSLQPLLAAADKGDGQAAFRLGVIYEVGCGVRRNGRTAAGYYELAGKHGHVDGAVRLGGYYVQGDVIGVDYKKARALLQGPAAKGHPLANFHLAVMAYRGDETKPPKPDIALAMKHFKASADGGFAQAQFVVGQALVEGKELPKDLKAAKAMLQRASNQGFPWAMAILGRLHAEGELADADAAEAFKWLMLAKQLEPEDSLLQQAADQSLALVRDKLDPDRRGRIMKQVFDFKPKIEWEEKI